MLLTEAGTTVAVLVVAYPFKVRKASLVEVAEMEAIGIVAATWEEAFTSSVVLKVTS